MSEGRDRRATPVDVAAIFPRRRASIFNDDSDLAISQSTPGPGPRNRIGRGGGRFPQENTPPLGSSSRRGRGSTQRRVLPSWYPRTPLRDITPFVIRAIERPPARFGENENIAHERTPSAKKAEREKRVKTLMSMR